MTAWTERHFLAGDFFAGTADAEAGGAATGAEDATGGVTGAETAGAAETTGAAETMGAEADGAEETEADGTVAGAVDFEELQDATNRTAKIAIFFMSASGYEKLKLHVKIPT